MMSGVGVTGGGEGGVSQGLHLVESTHSVSSKGSNKETEAPPTKVRPDRVSHTLSATRINQPAV